MQLLDRRGWRLMEQVVYDGDNVSIYQRRSNSASVSDACASPLRACFSAPQRER
jgi:hypothetical protein